VSLIKKLERAITGQVESISGKDLRKVSNYIKNLEAEVKRLSILKNADIEIEITE
jgi:hypothetical protein